MGQFFRQIAGTSLGFPLSIFGIQTVLSQRTRGYKYPTSITNRVRCWIYTRRCRVVAEKGNDTGARLGAHGHQIVFPFFDRLIDYAQQLSEFRLLQTPVDARQTKVLAQGLRFLRSPLQNAPIDRNR